MCGIAGILYFDNKSEKMFNRFSAVLEKLKHRGPNYQNHKIINNCILFHTRLSILDVSAASNQPFVKNTNYLCFNGEAFNYLALKQNVQGIQTTGDVEVMHYLLESHKPSDALNQVNGFFALAFYNSSKNELLIARDRLGIKPLYYYSDNEKFVFASELKALLEIVGKQPLNKGQLNTYLRLNYCAGNESIFNNIHQLPPGTFLNITSNNFKIENWFSYQKQTSTSSLFELLDNSVKLRLHADVPVGCFLSGGVDSSIISALATKHHKNIHTFSIGFKEEPFFDETDYANLVAKHIGSTHHEFKLSNTDFLENIHPFLNSIDEPFADSSALNFYILSKLTSAHVKVALSGDGADELFKGYNKHKALLLSHSVSKKLLAKTFYPFSNLIPKSRQGFLQNKARQLQKFKDLITLTELEKQQYLAQISTAEEVSLLLKHNSDFNYFNTLFKVGKSYPGLELDDTFDLEVVLKDDMLVKADRFSMQHGIEIRNPFLDHRIVNYALNLTSSEKINKSSQKIILRKQFEQLLPKEIFLRAKKGFELPLWKWLNRELKSEIETKWLSKAFIEEQNLFSYTQVEKLKTSLFSKSPGDSAAKVWALIVFQNWYMQNKNYIS